MPTVIIENFSSGLDTRRSVLTSKLGVLATLTNAHINQGGEIEPRKSFVATDIPTMIPTFGIEALKDSIVVFGGDDDTGITWPTGVTYQRLVRNVQNDVAALCPVSPPGPTNFCADCVDYLAADKCIGVIFSTVFNSKPFVIAQMGDITTGVANDTYCAFYNGEPIKDLYFGDILPGITTPLQLYCMLVTAINNTGIYTADINDAGTGVTITGKEGAVYQVNLNGTGSLCSGLFTALDSLAVSRVPGQVAVGGFQVVDGIANPGVNQVTQISIGGTNLLTGGTWPSAPAGAVDYITSINQTAANIVSSINAGTSTHHFKATNKDNSVSIFADASGTTANTKDVVVTVSSKIMIGQYGIAFSGTGFLLEYVQADGMNLMGTTYTYPIGFSSRSLVDFVANVAILINNNTTAGLAHGFIAMGNGNILKVSKKVTSSADKPVAMSVRITPSSGNTGQVVDGGGVSLVAYTDIPIIEVDFYFNQIGKASFQATRVTSATPIRAVVSGGVAPYTYNWRVTDNPYIFPTNPNTAITTLTGALNKISYNDIAQHNGSGTLYLDVTDAAGTSVTAIGVPLNFVAIIS